MYIPIVLTLNRKARIKIVFTLDFCSSFIINNDIVSHTTLLNIVAKRFFKTISQNKGYLTVITI